MLFCVSAVVSVVVSIVGRESASGASGPLATQTTAFGSGFVVLVFGLALIQGVNGVRIFVLGSTALLSLGMIAMAALFHSVRELQALAGAILLTSVGYFTLLLQKEASKARVVAAVSLIVAGVAASVAAQTWVGGLARRAFGAELRKVASAEREYDDPAAGLSIAVPPGWVILEKDAEMYSEVPSKVTLADPEAGTVAFLNQEGKPPGLLTLDHYLDAVLARLRESGLSAEQSERRDAMVGRAPARRMALTWTDEGRAYSGFISAWLDGSSIFTLIGATIGEWTDSTEARFAALEGALRFTAPVETALTDAEARLTAECPLFTSTSVRTIARRIAPGSATEVYFKVGWTWALKGQGQLDPAAASELGGLMSEVFAGMSRADRRGFGAYSEKLRGGQRTTRGEDVAAMRTLGRATSALAPDSLARLQTLTDAALTVGGLL